MAWSVVAVLSGSGSGMMLMASMVLLQQYFNRRRALAASLSGTGFSVGGLVSGPLIATLLDLYGVHGTLLIIAALYFQICVFGALYRPAPGYSRALTAHKVRSADNVPDTKELDMTVADDKRGDSSRLQDNAEPTVRQFFLDSHEDHQRPTCCSVTLVTWLRQLFADIFDFSVLHCVYFPLFLIGILFLFFGYLSFMQHTPSRAAHFGIEPHLLSVLPTLICSSMLVSRFILGFVANSSCTSLVLQFAVCATLGGIVQITTWLATSFETMAVYCLLQGTLNGQLCLC